MLNNYIIITMGSLLGVLSSVMKLMMEIILFPMNIMLNWTKSGKKLSRAIAVR